MHDFGIIETINLHQPCRSKITIVSFHLDTTFDDSITLNNNFIQVYGKHTITRTMASLCQIIQELGKIKSLEYKLVYYNYCILNPLTIVHFTRCK